MRVNLFEASEKDIENFKEWMRKKPLVIRDIVNNIGTLDAFCEKYIQYCKNKKIAVEHRDINALINGKTGVTQQDIYNEVFSLMSALTTKKAALEIAKQKAEKGSEIVYPSSKSSIEPGKPWIVRRIDDYNASWYYGRNTEWCVTGTKRWVGSGESGDVHWKSYASYGCKFYFYESTSMRVSYKIIDNECPDSTPREVKNVPVKYAVSLEPVGNKYNIKIWDAEDKRVSKLPDDAPDIHQIMKDDKLIDDSSSKGMGYIGDNNVPVYTKAQFDSVGIGGPQYGMLPYHPEKSSAYSALLSGNPDILLSQHGYLLDCAFMDIEKGYEDVWGDFKDETNAVALRSVIDTYNHTMSDDAYEGLSEDVLDEKRIQNTRLNVYKVPADGTGAYSVDIATNQHGVRPYIKFSSGNLYDLTAQVGGGTQKIKLYDKIEYIGHVWYVISEHELFLVNSIWMSKAFEQVSSKGLEKKCSMEKATEILHTTVGWKWVVSWCEMQSRFHEGRENKDKYKALVESAPINLNKVKFYDKRTGSILTINKKDLTYKIVKGTEKSLEGDYSVVDTSAIKAIVDVLKDSGYSFSARKTSDVTTEKLKEGLEVKEEITNEAYTELDRANAKKYRGQPVFRITGLIKVNGRIQMYVVGLGDRDEEKTNYFEPSIRSARYTTEESFLFLSMDSAQNFYREFRNYCEQDEFDLKDFHVSEYHPFNEITKIIPINSPLGKAFVGEQRIIKKSYEKD